MYNFNTLFGNNDAPSQALPSNLIAPELGEVSTREVDGRLQVAATVAMGVFQVGDGESCMTGLALDASQSMQDDYGRGRTIKSEAKQKFMQEGRFEEKIRDGVSRRVLTKEARQEAIDNGWTVNTRNIVQPPSVRMAGNLIRNFASGGVTSGSCEVIYWACGEEGNEIEPLQEVRHTGLDGLGVSGPRGKKFGSKTFLSPPFRYFTDKNVGTNGVYVFVTDGHIDDEQDVIAATHQLAARIHSGERASVKCVLLGVGKKVDRDQLARIDDMEMPAGLEHIDIWNAKVLGEMRDLNTMNDAWSEIFDPETVIGTSLRVFNESGELVHELTDEVKALITFEMPAGAEAFEMVIDGEMTVRQPLKSSASQV